MQSERWQSKREKVVERPVEVIDSFFDRTGRTKTSVWFIGKSLEFYLVRYRLFCKRLAEMRGCKSNM